MMVTKIAATMAFLAALVLAQTAPTGEHTQAGATRFPHVDELGTCWIPTDYDPATDFPENQEWIDYEDSASEIMRAECDRQPWMTICTIPLYWTAVPCDIYAVLAPAPEEEDEGFALPLYVVLPVQATALLFELLALMFIGLPYFLIFFTLAAIDFILDWVFWLLFGWYCPACAGIIIWIINIAYLPFWLMAWVQRLIYETYTLPIDGWMLFFGFSGCYLFIGKHCWYTPGIWTDDYMYDMDMPLLIDTDGFTNGFLRLVTPPAIEKGSDIIHTRRSFRKEIFGALPFFSFASSALDPLFANLDF